MSVNGEERLNLAGSAPRPSLWKLTEPKLATRLISFSYSTILTVGGRCTYEMVQLAKLGHCCPNCLTYLDRKGCRPPLVLLLRPPRGLDTSPLVLNLEAPELESVLRFEGGFMMRQVKELFKQESRRGVAQTWRL